MDGRIEELERLSARLRLAEEAVQGRRVALGRYALVWWQGEAADRYRDLVEERRAALERVADELDGLADTVDALVVAARVEAGPLPVVPEAS